MGRLALVQPRWVFLGDSNSNPCTKSCVCCDDAENGQRSQRAGFVF
jgi:hypothetical protein